MRRLPERLIEIALATMVGRHDESMVNTAMPAVAITMVKRGPGLGGKADNFGEPDGGDVVMKVK